MGNLGLGGLIYDWNWFEICAHCPDLSRDTPAPVSYAAAYSSTGKSDTEALYDVLSYTRNVLSLMGTDGNVKVNLTYRPTPPVYNYTPTHKHFHVYSPNNYYVTQPAAPAAPAYQPPAPEYHHHHHYPTRTVTTTTTRKFYLPYHTAAQQWNMVKSSGEVTTEYGNLASTSTSDYRRSNRAQSEFRETSGATEALDYDYSGSRRSKRAVSEFREADTGYEESKLDAYARAYGVDLRARSQARARSEFLDNLDVGAGQGTEFDRTNRRAKLEAALEEDEENYRRRMEERGASLRPRL